MSEQGYGDIFQFCRFGLWLKKYKIKSSLVIYDELFQFMNKQNIFNEYIKMSDFIENQSIMKPAYPLMSLPKIFDLEIDDLKFPHNYIKPDKKKLIYWNKFINKKKFNIGIAWQGTKDNFGYDRSISYDLYLRLLNFHNVNLFSLHSLNQSKLKINKNAINQIIFFDDLDKDYKFGDTAALIANLDLVITIDTSIAHLSAAMKKNTWVLLPFHSDWRWMLKTKQSYWYDSIKLFRSIAHNNWSTVMDNVTRELKKLMLENQALFSSLSGSGSTVFGIYQNYDQAMQSLEKIDHTKYQSSVTFPIYR